MKKHFGGSGFLADILGLLMNGLLIYAAIRVVLWLIAKFRGRDAAGLTDAMASPSIRTRVDVEADEEAMCEREAVGADDAGEGAGAAKAVGTDAGTGPVSAAAGSAAGTVPLAERLAALRAAELARTDRLVPPSPQAEPVLEVKGLSIAFPAQHGDVDIVDNVSFSVRPGETMGLVGESGCGKSITSMAVMGLLPPTARITGEIAFKGRDILAMTPAEHNALRGHEMSMIYKRFGCGP